MRVTNTYGWAAALLMAAQLSPALAQEGPDGPPSVGGGPDAETMTRIQEQKWMLEQQIELANLRNDLNAIQGPPRNSGESGGSSNGGQGDEASGAAGGQRGPGGSAGLSQANPNPERTWVMTQYSRYGQTASATVVSRFGELSVETGDAVGGWTVAELGPKGVTLRNDSLGERRIPFRDKWVPTTASQLGGSGQNGVGPPSLP